MSAQSGYANGRNDAQSGRGPANTNTMPYQTRQGYDAGYKQGQTQSNQNQSSRQ
jgi:hypothetical protein